MSYQSEIDLSKCLDGFVPPAEGHIELFDRAAKYNNIDQGTQGPRAMVKIGADISLDLVRMPDTGLIFLVMRTFLGSEPVVVAGQPQVNEATKQVKTRNLYTIDLVKPVSEDEGRAVLADIRSQQALALERMYGGTGVAE